MDDATKDPTDTTHRPSTDNELRIATSSANLDVERQCNDNPEESIPSTDEKPTSDANTVGWDGPNDPENPQNWPTRKKVTAVGMASMITFLS
jgi:hypothetical protein